MRTGFEESNNAHQRTAERGHAFEQELSVTQRKADNLVAEGSALRGQVSMEKYCGMKKKILASTTVKADESGHIASFSMSTWFLRAAELKNYFQLNEAKEERQALEAQLRQLRAGLAEGQETARKEGRRGAERLEARLKDLQKERSVVNGGCRYRSAIVKMIKLFHFCLRWIFHISRTLRGLFWLVHNCFLLLNRAIVLKVDKVYVLCVKRDLVHSENQGLPLELNAEV